MYYIKPNYKRMLTQFVIIFEGNVKNGDKGVNDEEIAGEMEIRLNEPPKEGNLKNGGKITFSPGMMKIHTKNLTIERGNTAQNYAELNWVYEVVIFDESDAKYYIRGGTQSILTVKRDATFLYHFLTMTEIDEELRNNTISAFIIEKMGLSKIQRNNKTMLTKDVQKILWNYNSTEKSYLIQKSKLETESPSKTWNKKSLEYLIERYKEFGAIQQSKKDNKTVYSPQLPISILQLILAFYVVDRQEKKDYASIREMYDYINDRYYSPDTFFAEKFLANIIRGCEKSENIEEIVELTMLNRFVNIFGFRLSVPIFQTSERAFVKDVVNQALVLFKLEEIE